MKLIAALLGLILGVESQKGGKLNVLFIVSGELDHFFCNCQPHSVRLLDQLDTVVISTDGPIAPHAASVVLSSQRC